MNRTLPPSDSSEPGRARKRAASSVQEAIQQSRPFRSTGQEALIGLLLTADLVRRQLSAVVEPRGLTLQQYNVLRILRGANAHGLPTLEIAHRMIEQTPGITRLLDRLEEKKLVSRERCRVDRRQVLCHISTAGLELLAALDEPMNHADERLLSALSPAELTRLVRLLDHVRARTQANLDPSSPTRPT
ncbi:MAG TPA: MarR family transcriptional regulator [Thermoanaerobaculia bacterium]|nr:MarR family transcriptional regulator [Thermoanaerobaculia bacterium]